MDLFDIELMADYRSSWKGRQMEGRKSKMKVKSEKKRKNFRLLPLTGVPEKLDSYTDSPPLSSRYTPHIVVSHPGVRTLPQPQLCNDIIHLWQKQRDTYITYNICLSQHTEIDITSGPNEDNMQNTFYRLSMG